MSEPVKDKMWMKCKCGIETWYLQDGKTSVSYVDAVRYMKWMCGCKS